jgi:hypothetical protein
MIFSIKLDQRVIGGGKFESDVSFNSLSRREESSKHKLSDCLIDCVSAGSKKHFL